MHKSDMITEKRNDFIDAIKGWAMLLVLVGHALYVTYDKPDCVKLFLVIYSFHMPLFMFISGYVTYKENRDIDTTWLKHRFVSLVIPFLVWMFVPYIIDGEWDINIIANYLMNVVKRPDYALWFLWVLFLNSFLLFVGLQVKKKMSIKNDWHILAILVFILNVINILIYGGNGWLGLGLFAWHSVFYISGYILAEYKKLYEDKKRLIIVLCSIIFLIFVPLWRRTEYPVFLQPYEGIWPGGLIVILSKVFNYSIGFCGIAFSVAVVYLMPNIIKKNLAYLGKYTLEIYVLHMYMFEMINFSNQYVNIICKVLAGIIGSLVWVYIIRKGALNLLLFGKNRKV